MSKRWPIHPIPQPNESLFSWLTRIASIYGMDLIDLVVYECGIELNIHSLYILDLSPPIELLNKLSELAGIEVQHIRALTAQVYGPLLIDSLEAKEENLFNDYTNQFYIFSSARQKSTKIANNWVPWLDINHFTTLKGCTSCLNEDREPYLRLYWRFPWMMTCPIHKLLLQRIIIFHRLENWKVQYYFTEYHVTTTPYALSSLCDIDHITLQAVTKGIVEVPSGSLHGGVWIRILRTLVEELNSLGTTIGKKAQDLMTPFWQELNLLRRQRCGKYSLFEKCDDDVQLTLMSVAALVFQSIFANKANFFSPSVDLLTPVLTQEKDLESVYQKTVDYNLPRCSYSLDNLSKQVDILIASMRSNPAEVRSFRNIMRGFDISGKRLPQIDQCLRELGISIGDT